MRQLIILLALSSIALFGCTENKVDETTNDNTVVEKEEVGNKDQMGNNDQMGNTEQMGNNNNLTFDKLPTYFEENGLVVGERGEGTHTNLGATKGHSLMLDDQAVEFYEYDLNNMSDEVKTNIEKIRSTGTIDINGVETPAIVNGNLVMISHDKYKEPGKLEELFKGYK